MVTAKLQFQPIQNHFNWTGFYNSRNSLDYSHNLHIFNFTGFTHHQNITAPPFYFRASYIGILFTAVRLFAAFWLTTKQGKQASKAGPATELWISTRVCSVYGCHTFIGIIPSLLFNLIFINVRSVVAIYISFY